MINIKKTLRLALVATLFGMSLAACSSSEDKKIDKALDKIEKAIKAKDFQKVSELMIDFEMNYDEDDLSKSQQKRFDKLSEDAVESLGDALDDLDF